VHTQKSCLNLLPKICSLDINFSNSSLIELSAYNLGKNIVTFLKFINYFTYSGLTFFVKTLKINSLYVYFENAVFLERELREMFNLVIYKMKDTRNLLLDYHYNSNPLLQDFSVEGDKEIYLNIYTDKLDYISTNYVEL
jgi:NADH:ubiquinone oxidoreductase subunit C